MLLQGRQPGLRLACTSLQAGNSVQKRGVGGRCTGRAPRGLGLGGVLRGGRRILGRTALQEALGQARQGGVDLSLALLRPQCALVEGNEARLNLGHAAVEPRLRSLADAAELAQLAVRGCDDASEPLGEGVETGLHEGLDAVLHIGLDHRLAVQRERGATGRRQHLQRTPWRGGDGSCPAASQPAVALAIAQRITERPVFARRAPRRDRHTPPQPGASPPPPDS
mmetsp:Transcript_111213/g.321531  ORF Transcript_111213/g.321531 Transcript_111213/m.321531 type:complete len:224 (-) Transcript_111213:13-684(-)